MWNGLCVLLYIYNHKPQRKYSLGVGFSKVILFSLNCVHTGFQDHAHSTWDIVSDVQRSRSHVLLVRRLWGLPARQRAGRQGGMHSSVPQLLLSSYPAVPC